MTLQHEIMTPILVNPPSDTTFLDLDGPWISVAEHHHIAFYCMIGEHVRSATFKVRKYNQALITAGNYEARHVPGVFHSFGRYWRNDNTDATATQCLTLHLVQNDSTADCAYKVNGHGSTGDVRGNLMVIEIPAESLGNDGSGTEYDAVQLVVQGRDGSPVYISALAILSEPRYAGRACTVPNVKVATRDW